MIIYPAIELHQGRCVRLRQGDPTSLTVMNEQPAQMARHWVDQGAEWLHIINLDGSLGATQSQLSTLHRPPNILVQRPGADKPEPPHVELARQLTVNLQQLRAIRQAVAIPIQFGGGLRTWEDIQLALELGADRVVLSTAAIETPELVAAALDKWGAERIVVGIDVRDGKVATHGWQRFLEIDLVDLGHRMHAIGVKRVVYTDISRDGMLSGVNVGCAARLGDTTNLHVIAGGGVACLGDIERLKAHEHYNIEGVVIGQALDSGALDLSKAVAIGHQPLRRRSAGIIPYRWRQGQLEFLLLYNLFFEQWQFPRGGVEKGECDKSCALREFAEETSLPIVQLHEACRVVLEYTATIRGHEIERTIVYFLAEVGPQEVRLDEEDHCEARWQGIDETWELLTETSPEQLPALDCAVAYLEKLERN
ncbi:MAG: HisA/HisF-related TIM barrel protein [Caldilineaceae bacterium]